MAVLVGATGLVDRRVLAMGERVLDRAGMRTGVVTSGYRPGSRVEGTGAVSLHAHRPSEAIDIGAVGATLTRLGQAALAEAGVANPYGHTHYEGEDANGWEILFNTTVGGNHFTHLHLGWRGGAVTQAPFPGVPGLPATAPQGRYSFHDLMVLWVGNGGAREHAAMAAQVALLESGGRPNAHAKTVREDSRGLWQINVKSNAHPEYANANLYDPRVNVQAAIRISRNGTQWSQWSTAAAARVAVAGRGPVTPPDVVRPGGGGGGIPGFGAVAGVVGSGASAVWGELAGVVDQATALIKFIGFLVDPKNWLRAVEFLFGFALIMLGLAVLVVEFSKRDSAAGAASRGIIRGAQRVTPTGRLAAYYKTSRRRTGGPARERRISTTPTPVYRSSSQNAGPGDEGIPF